MATIKFPTGVNGRVDFFNSSRVFSNYGVPQQRLSRSFEAVARRMAVLEDPLAPDSVLLTGQPSAGKAVARPDGRISLDLTQVAEPGEVTLDYVARKGGTSTAVTATVQVAAAEKGSGWGAATHYCPEVSGDSIVVEPQADTRIIHIAQAGLSAAEIAAREPGISGPDQVTAAWLETTPATGAEGAYYGETEALALDEDLGTALGAAMDREFRSFWALYRRGDTFTNIISMGGRRGNSKLHPILVGSYGTGALPVFTATIFDAPEGLAAHIVLQGLHWQGSANMLSISHVALDNFRATGESVTTSYPLTVQGVNTFCNAVTLRRFVVTDAVPDAAENGETWGRANSDRHSGSYLAATSGLLVEKVFMDMIGWARGYRADRDAAFPKSPEDRSHGIYQQSSCLDCTTRDLMILNPCHSAMQNRSGGIVERFFAAGGNTGINPGNGLRNAVDGDLGNWSLLSDYVQTVGGEKDFYDETRSDLGYLAVLSGGVQLAALRGTLQRVVITHCGEGTPITGPGDIGPVGRSVGPVSCFAVNESSGDGFPYLADYRVYDWKDYINPNVGVEDLDTSVLEATTIGSYADAWKGTTGADLQDFANHVRLETEPWTVLPDVLDYFQSAFGYGRVPRTEARTVTFLPAAQGQTPGNRADIRDDWDSGDLPGTVAGDSIDFAGYRVNWNMTPAQRIADVALNGATIFMHGGALKPTGTLTAGGAEIRLDGGAKLQFDGYGDASRLSLEANDARIANTGTMSGLIDARVVNNGELLFGVDAASWAVGAGTVEIVGGAQAGFDGTAGGTASLTFDAASRLNLKTGVTLFIGDLAPPDSSLSSINAKVLPRIGEILTGAGGATGRVLDVIQTRQTECRVRLEALNGTFVPGERLSGPTSYGGVTNGAVLDIGTVIGTPVATLGRIGAFTSGLFGRQAPQVTSTIACGGDLVVDLNGLPAGSYDLLRCNSLSGSFDTVSAPGLGARDLLLEQSATGLRAQITDAGSGRIEQITL